ncbi:MAG: GNAT family N-acetyltransferase [Verrucomicrobiota bacterium]|jgi:ribosomal protein S18 acetylase RimI-like enzyme
MQITELDPLAPMSEIRGLFLEYANSIETDLCFQNLERELAELPGRYAPPEGRLLLARDGAQAAGCVALRKIGGGICEMKRLYVRPVFRRKGLGRALAGKIIAAAREIGYERMRLDTLAAMKEAIQLYESLGFRRIQPYYDNPDDSAIFLELQLR